MDFSNVLSAFGEVDLGGALYALLMSEDEVYATYGCGPEDMSIAQLRDFFGITVH